MAWTEAVAPLRTVYDSSLASRAKKVPPRPSLPMQRPRRAELAAAVAADSETTCVDLVVARGASEDVSWLVEAEAEA